VLSQCGCFLPDLYAFTSYKHHGGCQERKPGIPPLPPNVAKTVKNYGVYQKIFQKKYSSIMNDQG
jgi:hypothetical protein